MLLLLPEFYELNEVPILHEQNSRCTILIVLNANLRIHKFKHSYATHARAFLQFPEHVSKTYNKSNLALYLSSISKYSYVEVVVVVVRCRYYMAGRKTPLLMLLLQEDMQGRTETTAV